MISLYYTDKCQKSNLCACMAWRQKHGKNQARAAILTSNSKNTAETQHGNIISNHSSSIYRYTTYIY